MANQAIQANPLYYSGPIWEYLNVMRGPVMGPQPRLAQGSGRTGDPALPGNAASMPGYLAQPDYQPEGYDYQPVTRQTRTIPIPKTISQGTDGRDMVGTYKPHDFTPADRFMGQNRSVANWQLMEFPPTYRNLLAYQQVRKYLVNSYTIRAQPLPQANYFLGYMINTQTASQLGSTGYGTMGG